MDSKASRLDIPTLGLVFLIHSSLLQAFVIPSGSMIPTFEIGDRIFVNKLAYAFKVPLSDWFGHPPFYFTHTGEVARGDVIVFKYPRDPSIYYVKRVIGLPGDSIEMKNKVIFVNGKAMVQTELTTNQANPRPEHAYLQHYDHTIGTIFINDQDSHSVNFGPITVPSGQYFCMGDNRDHSSDSRVWGFVPFENIEGRAFVIWLSHTFNRIGTLLH